MDKLGNCQFKKKKNGIFNCFFQQLIVNRCNLKNILMKTENVAYKVKYIFLLKNKLSQLNIIIYIIK